MNFFLLQRKRTIILLIICFSILSSCFKKTEPKTDEIIKTEYPKLAEEIVDRDFGGLWQFTDHKNKDVRTLAWKAIGKSEADDLQDFIDYAIQNDDPLVWHALSLQPLTGEQVDSIADKFADESIQSESVCHIFFIRGDDRILNMLLERPELLIKSKICSKAVGGILSRIQVSDLTRRQVFDLAFNSQDETIWRNLLYGLYRSRINRPEKGSVFIENIATLLDVQGELFTLEMDRYIIRISGQVGLMNVMNRRSDRELNQAIQLAVELAQNVRLFERDKLNHPYIKRLLKHNVDNVVAQTLQSLQEFDSIPIELLHMIEFEIAPVTRDPEVFFEVLNVLAANGRDIEEYESKIEFMRSQNPYLSDRIFSLYSKFESNEDYLERLENEIYDGGVAGLEATQVLTNFYAQNYEENPELTEPVKKIVLSALEEDDPSVLTQLSTFLSSPIFFPGSDYTLLYDLYSGFVEASRWENAKVIEDVLVNRFPDRFEALDIPEKPFHIPNWERLYEMGTKPFWTLETEKGTIEIQLDPLASPFTVSSIDSLTRAGEYDGIPFHRVVRSFVIQGGDIERQDGYGGPDYKLPTEPSFKSFERGMVGMASDGTDTEGSQYFVMLNWSPHLDPNYTIFGKVTKGMDVVDRIQVGDRVLEARIDF